MNSFLSLNISIGILLVLVGIMVYCFYKTIESIPKFKQLLNEYKKSQEELKQYVNNSKSCLEDINFKCPNNTMICNQNYACDACPYNKEQ